MYLKGSHQKYSSLFCASGYKPTKHLCFTLSLVSFTKLFKKKPQGSYLPPTKKNFFRCKMLHVDTEANQSYFICLSHL